MRCINLRVTYLHSYYGRQIGNHTQDFKWYRYHFQWSWVTSNPHFKVTIILTNSKSCMIYPMVNPRFQGHGVIFRPIDAVNVLCVQLMRDLFAIARFLFCVLFHPRLQLFLSDCFINRDTRATRCHRDRRATGCRRDGWATGCHRDRRATGCRRDGWATGCHRDRRQHWTASVAAAAASGQRDHCTVTGSTEKRFPQEAAAGFTGVPAGVTAAGDAAACNKVSFWWRD